MKTYRPSIFTNLPLGIIPVILLVPLAENPNGNALLGFLILSACALIFIALPPALLLKVGDDSVEVTFFGFSLTKLERSKIMKIEYKNLLLSSLGFGKGLIITPHTGKSISIDERLYGKEALAAVKKSLGKEG